MDHVDCARAALRSVAMRPSCAASTWVTSEDKTTFHSFIHVDGVLDPPGWVQNAVLIFRYGALPAGKASYRRFFGKLERF